MSNPYATVSSSSITVYVPGKDPVTIKSDHKNFETVRTRVLNSEFTSIEDLMVEGIRLQNWSAGAFEFKDNQLTWVNGVLPDGLRKRMEESIRKDIVPRNLMRFWELLQQNPSYRSVQQLFNFMGHADVAIGDSGYIYAYKGVQEDYRDTHSRTFVNKPGVTFYMPRNLVADDPRRACMDGFHVGSLKYVRTFGKRIVLVRVHPRDVVSIPYDHDSQKMRCCRYEVLADWSMDKVLPMEFDDSEYWEDTSHLPSWWDDIPARIATATEVVEETSASGEVKEVSKPVYEDLDKREVLDTLLARYAELDSMFLKDLRPLAKEKYGILNVKGVRGGKPALIDRMIQSLISEGGALDEGTYREFRNAVSARGEVASTDKSPAESPVGSASPWQGVNVAKWEQMDGTPWRQLAQECTLLEIRVYAKSHLGIRNVKAIRGGKLGLLNDPRFWNSPKRQGVPQD